ncbi:flagellar hook protein FlgE [Erwiniaceae bacterium BAC15a-03b]|uniref:Flagellar hook protein FlgE n=1 Tax=Winslowiella arboricola TaxID=2978220 RepID=A0A9J6PQH7_9GAMM|nr:flagellar hook protein FlgE [Winslowiella arboricola]MCU5773033.1 flagellar hook protein FlgE [Winslowiella arboricola]MCU5777872.1 flagellar hook protein FlgE [Winslowiella arboricola]
MAFSQAVSGLNAASSNLDVIGNNIANSATSGFKSSTVAFADMFAGSNVGMGVKVAGVIQNFNDGTATTTSRGLDVAINKQGFFRLTDTAGAVYYSRNGQFTLDENRNIVNTQGLKVTGYPASGSPMAVQTGASPVALTIPTTQMTAKATSTASLVANLNSSDSVPTNATFSTTDADSYNAKTTVTAYDSLGNTHQIDLYFVKDATDNSWTVHPVDASTGTAAADFTMTFSSATGELLTPTTAQPIAMTSLNGADASTFNLSMTGSMQQNTGADTFGNPTQDGYAPGDLTSYSISDDGTIVGSYSNNRTQVLGQIALANFANPEGLSSAGDNVWQETTSSGQPLIGVAGTGNLGTLTSGALESSNVDLSKELVNMIVAQRNYQSNAQTIKTQDQILNTLVNLR